MIATRLVDGRPFALRARRWAHDNLFSSYWNTGLTIVTVLVFTIVLPLAAPLRLPVGRLHGDRD